MKNGLEMEQRPHRLVLGFFSILGLKPAVTGLESIKVLSCFDQFDPLFALLHSWWPQTIQGVSGKGCVLYGDPGGGSFTNCSFTSFSVRTDYSSPVDVLHGRSFQDDCSVGDNPDFSFMPVFQCSLLRVFTSTCSNSTGYGKTSAVLGLFICVQLLHWLII